MKSFGVIASLLLTLAAETTWAQTSVVPNIRPNENLAAAINRGLERFAVRGTGRGSGYRQFKRWEWAIAARSYPSGELVNVTALAWLGHYRKARRPDFVEQMAAGIASGVGNGNWRSVGPTRYVRGQSGYNGGIGRINTVAFHPTNPMILYVGTPAGGVWRSQDGGDSWTSLTDGLPVIGVSDIAIDPLRPTTIYVMTGDQDGRHTSSLGVVKSTDDGLTWQLTQLVWKRNELVYGARLAIDPATPSTLLAATNLGLQRTTTAGDSWSLVESGDFRDIKFHPTKSNIVYAATFNTVYRSTDGGQAWAPLTQGLPSVPSSDNIRLAVSPARPDTLYVLYGAEDGFSIGLYRSDNAGNSFSLRSNSPNIFGYEMNGTDNKSQSNYDLALAVDPANAERVHVGGVNTWRSDNGGATWSITSHWFETGQANYTHADIHFLAYRNALLYAGTDGGLYRSADAGATWANLTPGMAITQVTRLCGTPQDSTLVYFGAQDGGSNRYTLAGQAMTQIWGADGFQCQIHPGNSKIVYFSEQNGGLRRSDDGGNISKPIAPQGAGAGPWLTPYTLAPSDPDTIYACYTDVWRSRNRGEGWQNLSVGLVGMGGECRQIAVAPSDRNTLYVAKHVDRSWTGAGVFRTRNGGNTWEEITGTLPLAQAAITDLAVSSTDAKRIWVTFSGYNPALKVFTSNDGGDTWTNITGDLPNLPANTIATQNTYAQDNKASHGIYVGFDVGVYYRDDTLNAWVPFMNFMPNAIVNHLRVDEARQKILAATFGRGIWESDVHAPCPDSYEFNPANAPPIVGVTVFQAQRTIRSAAKLPGSVTVDVSYRAGERVHLQPGFEVGKGATFKASIGQCRGIAQAVALMSAGPATAPAAGVATGLAAGRRPPTGSIPYSGPLEMLE